MSLNLGPAGCDACKRLAPSPEWADFRAALEERARQAFNQVLEIEPGHKRDDAAGYARALRDLCVATESATTGVAYAQVKKPGPVEKPSAASR